MLLQAHITLGYNAVTYDTDLETEGCHYYTRNCSLIYNDFGIETWLGTIV